MDLRLITESKKSAYNSVITHVIQSWEWGEFRKSLGTPLARYGLYEGNKLKSAFQITFHQIPFTNFFVGYLPKGPFPDKEFVEALAELGQQKKCAFIKIEPNIKNEEFKIKNLELDLKFHPSPKPLFTKHNFILDLTKSEEELLKNLHPKTRYNIKTAQKHGVKVQERIDDEAFDIYLKLYFETTKRQGYHGHNETYHRKVWQTLKEANMARLLIAFYHPPHAKNPKPLTAWMLFNFHQTLYYPYGGSSLEHKEVMANNLVAWEAIRLGKKLGLKEFDMWGALSPDANPKDSWFGFHRFKQGYGGELVEYMGTYDLVFNWPLYILFTTIDRLTPVKVFLLKLLQK